MPRAWRPVAACLVLALAACGGDPLPASSPDAVTAPEPADSPAPEPSTMPEAEPTPTPPVMEEPPPGSDAARASIEIVGLGHPPPEPPIHGGGLWVEAIVLHVMPDVVEFYIDDRRVRTDGRWPYTLGADRFDTRSVSDGFHVVTARAVFEDGTALVAHEPMWVENR
jgi:hypothetical protein